MITISVVIPTYNRIGYLRACLESVATQRRKPDEIIVVDDGSTDGTYEEVCGMEGVTLLKQANAGASAARNRGASAASGDYIAFLDSDDLWFPWSLQAMMTFLEEHRPSLLFARFEDFSDAAPMPQESPLQGRCYEDFLAAAPDGVFAGAGMMVVDRAAFLAVRGFDEDRLNAEDHDLALRLGTASGFVQVMAPIIVAHRVHGGNAMGDLSATLEGLTRIVARERAGQYPGGALRSRERRNAITRHVRPAVLSSIRAGNANAALKLYKETFVWNTRAGKAAYLAAAPVLRLASGITLPKQAPSKNK